MAAKDWLQAIKEKSAQAEAELEVAAVKPTIPVFLRVPRVCEALGLKKSKVYELLAAGRIKSVKIDGARRIPESALREFCAGLSGGD